MTCGLFVPFIFSKIFPVCLAHYTADSNLSQKIYGLAKIESVMKLSVPFANIFISIPWDAPRKTNHTTFERQSWYDILFTWVSSINFPIPLRHCIFLCNYNPIVQLECHCLTYRIQTLHPPFFSNGFICYTLQIKVESVSIYNSQRLFQSLLNRQW